MDMIDRLREGFAEGKANVSDSERWASFILGGMLTLLGVQLRSPRGALLALSGGSLIHRAVTGHCYTYDALGVDTRAGEPPLPGEPGGDLVQRASEESFPAGGAPGLDIRAGKPPRAGEPGNDIVQEASEESFPASDAPGWTGLIVGRPRAPHLR